MDEMLKEYINRCEITLREKEHRLTMRISLEEKHRIKREKKDILLNIEKVKKVLNA